MIDLAFHCNWRRVSPRRLAKLTVIGFGLVLLAGIAAGVLGALGATWLLAGGWVAMVAVVVGLVIIALSLRRDRRERRRRVRTIL